MKKTAIISQCGTYRYRLGRRWADGSGMLFVMLNPSTADADLDDPTIRKCIGFASRAGCGAIEVVNLYAYRATDPKALKAAGWPVGPENHEHTVHAIMEVMHGGGIVVAAWGANARGRPEASEMLAKMARTGIAAHALRILPDGTPAHPLMLPYSCSLARLDTAAEVE